MEWGRVRRWVKQKRHWQPHEQRLPMPLLFCRGSGIWIGENSEVKLLIFNANIFAIYRSFSRISPGISVGYGAFNCLFINRIGFMVSHLKGLYLDLFNKLFVCRLYQKLIAQDSTDKRRSATDKKTYNQVFYRRNRSDLLSWNTGEQCRTVLSAQLSECTPCRMNGRKRLSCR